MRVILKNESNKTLLINLNGRNIVLRPFGKDFFSGDTNRISLNITTDDSYSSEKHAEKAGYYCFHRFITVSQYDFIAENDLNIKLYVETKKGDHFESYQRVQPYCKEIVLPEPIYTLKDESEVKEKFVLNEKLERKAERRADIILKVDNIGTILSNIFAVLLLIGITAIIFTVICQNFSLKAAIITYAVIILTGCFAYRITSKFAKRVGKIADRFFDSKLFNKTMDKANEKFEEKYVYCKDMPEELFKDRSSFFDPNYISAVFKYSSKSM